VHRLGVFDVWFLSCVHCVAGVSSQAVLAPSAKDKFRADAVERLMRLHQVGLGNILVGIAPLPALCLSMPLLHAQADGGCVGFGEFSQSLRDSCTLLTPCGWPIACPVDAGSGRSSTVSGCGHAAASLSPGL
jgi:hypothetical protein